MRTFCLVGVVLGLTLAIVNLQAAEPPEAAVLEEAPPIFTLGAQGGENVFEGFGDILVPMYLTRSGLWFVNPRATLTDDDEEELNVGVGYRHLFSNLRGKENCDAILGANVYYDSRWTRHDNHFNQVGFGLEMLSPWVDARANYYLPENDEELIDSYTQTDVQTHSSTRTRWYDPYAEGNEIKQKGVRVTRTTTTTTTYLFERFEQAREGWDAEAGVKVPGLEKWAEVRVFAGYYSWDNEYAGGDRIEGAKGRVEVRVLPALYLDAAVFEDEELFGSDWMAGGRLVLPFDTKRLSEKKNPFAGALANKEAPPFANRLLDMVMRDLAVRTEESGWIENGAARQVCRETRTRKKRLSDTLMDEVTFVDGDNLGVENGTAEHPYNTIQEGVDNALSPVVVMPNAAGEYVENVLMPVDVQLYGAHAIVGHGGRRLGGRPTVDGRAASLPTIRMADECLVAGFRIVNTGDLGPAVDPILGTLGYERTGLYAGNATDLRIQDNIVENCSQGGLFVATAVANFDIRVDDCVFQNNSSGGFLARAVGTGLANDTFNAAVWNSSFLNNAGDGCAVRAQDYTDATMDLRNLDASFNGFDGVGAYVDGPEAVNAIVRMQNLFADANGQAGPTHHGLVADLTPGDAGAVVDLDVLRCAAYLTSVGSGLFINMSGRDLTLDVRGCDFSFNDDNGLLATLAAGNNVVASISDNWFAMNGFGVWGSGSAGARVAATANGVPGPDPNLLLTFQDNLVDNQEEFGAVLDLTAPWGVAAALVSGNVIRGNDSIGLDLNGNAMLACAAVLENNRVLDNGLFYGSSGVDLDLNSAQAVALIRGLQASGNAVNGLDVSALGTSASLLWLEDITAEHNGFNGILGAVNAVAGNANCYFADIAANRNAFSGISLTLNAPAGDAVALGGLSERDVARLMAVILGPGFPSLEAGVRFVQDMEPHPVTANRNGSDGLLVMTTARDLSLIALNGATASDNQILEGINLVAASTAGDAIVGVWNARADNNGGSGLHIDASGPLNASVALRRVRARGNGLSGANVRLGAAGGTANAFVERSTFVRNGGSGVRMNVNAALTSNLDFGGGPHNSHGQNVFAENALFGLNNAGLGLAVIENNYWAGGPPVFAGAPVADVFGPGALVPATWLDERP